MRSRAFARKNDTGFHKFRAYLQNRCFLATETGFPACVEGVKVRRLLRRAASLGPVRQVRACLGLRERFKDREFAPDLCFSHRFCGRLSMYASTHVSARCLGAAATQRSPPPWKARGMAPSAARTMQAASELKSAPRELDAEAYRFPRHAEGEPLNELPAEKPELSRL